MNEETQMIMDKTIGASSTKRNSSWQPIDWQKAEALVLQLQMRIAKAERKTQQGESIAATSNHLVLRQMLGSKASYQQYWQTNSRH